MNLQAGDVVLIHFQFQQRVGLKVRPAVVILDTGDEDFMAAPITSQNRGSPFDLPIVDWESAGVNVPSTARLHKLCALAKREISLTLGRFSPPDFDRLRELLCHVYCPGLSDVS